ncbi:DUF3987 domain-containing protein [Ancylobacter sp. Lp-2]|uniref:DUF3987 domain-containing protein n=1 Tax=Ancylobacter sp. Lp-2 TaxID=2881339 RepID=UPI001E434553|nr:DUF3987 domain-containing protein [Ancylobacter sp. Lp-2]MCB4771452.1 DUF3987 domain-containing protein [Ancylobacter sp. Lp-2]
MTAQPEIDLATLDQFSLLAGNQDPRALVALALLDDIGGCVGLAPREASGVPDWTAAAADDFEVLETPLAASDADRLLVWIVDMPGIPSSTLLVHFAVDGTPRIRVVRGKVGDDDLAMRIIGRICTPPAERMTAANDNTVPDPIDPWAQHASPALPPGLLPPVLEEFARTEAGIIGVDAGGVAAAALAVCAASIPDRIKLRVKKHDDSWHESARLWVALVGNPSAKKSPVINIATHPLKEIDGELFAEFVKRKRLYDAMPTEARGAEPPPKNTRVRLEDTTIEAAQEILKDSPDGLLCIRDELSGWFGSMEKYAAGRGAAVDRSFWLQSFNGGSYTVNRINRGSVWIDNLSISLLGGIQPDPMRRIAADLHDDGLLQRLFPIVMQPAGVGLDVPVPPVVADYAILIKRLHVLKLPVGEKPPIEKPLRFSEGALAIRQELTERHHRLATGWEAVNKKLAAHIGKYDGLFARLCVVFHCVEHADLLLPVEVSEDTARRAGEFLHRFLFKHAVAFYSDVLSAGERHDAVLAAAGVILSKGLREVTARDVMRGDRMLRGIDLQDIEAVMQQLDAYGWLEPQISLRRDSRRWSVRPEVHTLFARKAADEKQRRAEVRALIAASLSN